MLEVSSLGVWLQQREVDESKLFVFGQAKRVSRLPLPKMPDLSLDILA